MMGEFWNRLIHRRLFWLREGCEDSVSPRLLSAFFTPTPTRDMRRSSERFSGRNILVQSCLCLRSFFPSFESTKEQALQSLTRVCNRYSQTIWKNSNKGWKNLGFTRLCL